jgi:hypothetical protein
LSLRSNPQAEIANAFGVEMRESPSVFNRAIGEPSAFLSLVSESHHVVESRIPL